MKDHELRELVNALTATAREYAQTQQLRERIARLVLDAVGRDAKPSAGGEAMTKAQIDFLLGDSFLAANGSVYATRIYDFVAAIEAHHGVPSPPAQSSRETP